ncbi:hypothetical protein B0H19DRAFT_1375973 [Mycena capillaripes]|nr:hypothetical protein B0H19DRAFT_1375973 [Mycena capillaripes]
MTKLPSFPPELLDLIFSSLDSEDLWVIAQVSSGFQCLALFLLFATYDLSASQIYSGIVSLPGKASFLLPRIYSIHPIQKLTILHKRPTLRVLTSILSAMPPIPDVTISDADGLSSHERASVITPLCSAAVDPAVIFLNVSAGGDYGCGRLSPSHLRSPIPFDSLHSLWKPFEPLWQPFSLLTIINILAFPSSLVFQTFIWCLTNLFIFLAWLHRRATGLPRDLKTRIADDIIRRKEGSIRVQAVSASDCGPSFLVTCGPSHVTSLTFMFRSLFPLSIAQHTALLAALPLGDDFTTLQLDADCGISLGLLLSFVQRHPSLRILELGSAALLPASLVEGSLVHTGSTISRLTAPVTYIPYLLPALPAVENLTIRFHDYHLRYSAYARAIAAIDPASPLHSLTLRFNYGLDLALYAHMLPWHAKTNTGMEGLFHNIRVLSIGDFKISQVDTERLEVWLLRFPRLTRVGICTWTFAQSISEAIQRAREWEGIVHRGR